MTLYLKPVMSLEPLLSCFLLVEKEAPEERLVLKFSCNIHGMKLT